ncbi:hypothetical protein M0R36_04350 [bacterium]|nr:hypothetical protein [bacterium]
MPAERASKLGHLEVIKSPLVCKLCKNFEDPNSCTPTPPNVSWQALPTSGKERRIIFSTDGSLQTIENPQPPYKAIAFIKTALLKLDQYSIAKLDKETPNPFAIRDLMKDSALFHATAFPLRHVSIPGKTIYHAVREIIFESVKDKGLNDALNGAMMETLKWLVYEKWNPTPKTKLEEFGCPHCNQNVATLPFDQEKGDCPGCGKEIFITDMFGLHLNMQDDFAPNQLASDYMSVSETLMILTPIRHFWETNKEVLNNCLMVKDGPLSLRATLSKLAAPIRRFFKHAKENGVYVAMIGQEKSGMFFDHLQLIGKHAPVGSIFIPNNDYIRGEIQHSNSVGLYGQDTNYGAKLFIKYNDYHKMVINIPTGERGEFVQSPSLSHLIGLESIVATLPKILSNRFEGALLPIELANGVASLSTYPSAKALELFSVAVGKE